MRKWLVLYAIVLIVAAATTRVLRDAGFIHLPPNVAPVAALALFSGTYLPRKLAFILPISAMLISDVMIGFYTPAIMASVYLSFAASGLIGLWLRTHKRFGAIIAASLVSSTLFFIVTNAAVWAFATLYPHTGAGLLASYLAGLPFFRNTVLGDLAFVGMMFGMYQGVVYLVGRSRVVTNPQP